MRREFNLPEDDEGSLNALGLPWETIKDGTRLWVILNDFPVSGGFTVEKSSVAIEIPPNYPSAGLDMAYFLPHLPGGLSDQFMELGYHVYIMSTQSTNVDATRGIQYATTCVLLLLTFMLNFSAIFLRARVRLRKKG